MFLLETLKHANGNYTDDVIKRAGKIVGSLGQALDAVFLRQIGQVEDTANYNKQFDYSLDVRKFVGKFEGEGLFKQIPGRKYQSFPTYECAMKHIKRPADLKARLLKYTEKMDRQKEALQ